MSILRGVERKGTGRTARMLFRALGAEVDDVIVVVPTKDDVTKTISFLQRAAPCLKERTPGVLWAGDGRTITVRDAGAWERNEAYLFGPDATFVHYRVETAVLV